MTESRWLDREELARYIAVRVDRLPRLQRAGKLPAPSLHLGPRCPRWDRQAVDALFGGRVASASQAIDALVEAAANEILGER